VFVDSEAATLARIRSTNIAFQFDAANCTLTANNFNSTSDESLKIELKPILSPLSKLLYINGVHFTWKQTGKPSIGIIAQDVEKVFPELVNIDGFHKSVNYNGLVAVLIEAIRELRNEIEEIKTKLEPEEN
jgi:hypothetical protein